MALSCRGRMALVSGALPRADAPGDLLGEHAWIDPLGQVQIEAGADRSLPYRLVIKLGDHDGHGRPRRSAGEEFETIGVP
jgi:hypothetical protein